MDEQRETPVTLRETLRWWKMQYDWEPFTKVKDAIITAVSIGCLLGFYAYFLVRLVA